MQSAFIAVAAGVALALALLVPWAARHYRRRGTVGPGAALLAFATVVYALALVTYTLLPLPSNVAGMCRGVPMGPQLRPLAFLDDIGREGGISRPASLLRNPAVTQVLFNVLLFVPLGMFVRYFFARGRLLAGVAWAALAGLGVSLLIEFTQLTGDWFLYPCAYRLFDVDDLAANTAGALIGGFVAPVLALVPWQHRDDVASSPRPVTAGRRLLGMLCDVLTIWLLGATLVVLLNLAVLTLDGDMKAPAVTAWRGTFGFVPALVQLILVLSAGRTLGEVVVRLRPADTPALWQRFSRWALGVGGWSVLTQTGSGVAETLATALAIVAVISVWTTRHRRGFAYFATRMQIEDDRTSPQQR
jgi:glycopeptide antibiotics resistance protein